MLHKNDVEGKRGYKRIIIIAIEILRESNLKKMRNPSLEVCFDEMLKI